MSYSRTIHGPQSLAALSIETHNAPIAVTVVDQDHTARQPELTRAPAREVQRLGADSQHGVIEVVLSTEDGPDSLSRKIIDQAEVQYAPNGVHIVINDEKLAMNSGVTIVNNVYGNVVISGGTVTVNGDRIDSRSGGTNNLQGITVTVRLPQESPLRVRVRNAYVTVTGGVLEYLDFKGHNGTLSVEATRGVKARGHNGTLSIRGLQGDADLSVHNGTINVVALTPGTVEAEAHNGAIRVSDPNGLGCDRLVVRTSVYNGKVVKP